MTPKYMTLERFESLEQPPVEEVLVVDSSYLNRLETEVQFLNALRACGVDNWVGYDDAWDMMDDDQ